MNFLRQFIFSVKKELLLVFRDRIGLVMLFLMPSMLVVIMTLIQENVLKSEIDFYLCDQDKNEIIRVLEENLSLATNIKLHKLDECSSKESLQNILNKEGAQFGLYIPKDASSKLQKASTTEAQADVQKAMSGIADAKNRIVSNPKDTEVSSPQLALYFDPIISDNIRVSLQTLVEKTISQVNLENRLKAIFAELGTQMGEKFNMPSLANSMDFSSLTKAKTDIGSSLTKQFIAKNGFVSKPSAIQQNVSAWTIFGIFFIIVPLAGAMVNERQSGTMFRLRTTPANPLVFILGKIVAYILVCFVQASFIFVLTTNILPLIGGEAFIISKEQLPLVCLLLLAISMAATGYGAFLGVILKTYEQVSVVGPISIVIAAAIGGIMVPTYVMPDFMQSLSHVSPLAWGLEGFYDIFLRGGQLSSILPEMTYLLSFFIITLMLSVILPKLRR